MTTPEPRLEFITDSPTFPLMFPLASGDTTQVRLGAGITEMRGTGGPLYLRIDDEVVRLKSYAVTSLPSTTLGATLTTGAVTMSVGSTKWVFADSTQGLVHSAVLGDGTTIVTVRDIIDATTVSIDPAPAFAGAVGSGVTWTNTGTTTSVTTPVVDLFRGQRGTVATEHARYVPVNRTADVADFLTMQNTAASTWITWLLEVSNADYSVARNIGHWTVPASNSQYEDVGFEMNFSTTAPLAAATYLSLTRSKVVAERSWPAVDMRVTVTILKLADATGVPLAIETHPRFKASGSMLAAAEYPTFTLVDVAHAIADLDQGAVRILEAGFYSVHFHVNGTALT